VKTAVSVPDDLFDEAEVLARRLGLSRSEMYARALERFLRTHRHDRITEALNRVYAAESSVLDPALARMQLETLRREDD
jgi:metal-responsive CopG/Arc/MetJ family transcriptional regulator